MAVYNKYTSGVDGLVKAMNSGTDAFKVALANTVNAADTTFVAGTTDLATGSGYTAGGNAASTSTATTTAGVFKLVLSSPATWTATGGSIGPFRYAILWDSTTSTPLGYWDYGSSITLASGESFSASLDATNGVYTVT
jgi:hypothetical protein